MDDYAEVTGLEVVVYLNNGEELYDYALAQVADVYESANGQVLVLVDNSGAGRPALAVPTGLVRFVGAD